MIRSKEDTWHHNTHTFIYIHTHYIHTYLSSTERILQEPMFDLTLYETLWYFLFFHLKKCRSRPTKLTLPPLHGLTPPVWKTVFFGLEKAPVTFDCQARWRGRNGARSPFGHYVSELWMTSKFQLDLQLDGKFCTSRLCTLHSLNLEQSSSTLVTWLAPECRVGLATYSRKPPWMPKSG